LNNERIAKQIVTARMEGIRKRENQRKRLNDKVEKDLKIVETRNWFKMAKDRKKCSKILLEARIRRIFCVEHLTKFRLNS
jgi:hypothetical protein